MPTKKPAKKTAKKKAMKPLPPVEPGTVRLLSGGNPQIAKGDGDGPVQAYIAAMPEWKSDAGRRLDALITAAVPGVQKAVRWNSPFYDAGKGYFVSFHVFTKYVKVTFLFGSSLKPMPPGPSKDPNARYLDLKEGELDDAMAARFTAWVKQASAIPGWKPS